MYKRQLVYDTEKNLRELGDRLDPSTKAKVEEAVGRVKEAMKDTSNIEGLRTALDELTKVWHEAASKLYQAAGGRAGAESAGEAQTSQDTTGPTQEGEVIDADYEVVDEDKKE